MTPLSHILARLWNDRRGAAMVEFAFALPMLVITIVGVIEVGRAIHYHQALTEGVRAGVRYLSRVADPCSSEAKEAATGLLVTRSIGWSNPPVFVDWPVSYASTSSDPDFQVDFIGCDAATGELAGSTVTMTAEYAFADSLGMLRWIGHAGGFPLRTGHQELWFGL